MSPNMCHTPTSNPNPSRAAQYPVTATQWHPEKNAFEWARDLDIPHDKGAIAVTQAVANFVVDEVCHLGRDEWTIPRTTVSWVLCPSPGLRRTICAVLSLEQQHDHRALTVRVRHARPPSTSLSVSPGHTQQPQ